MQEVQSQAVLKIIKANLKGGRCSIVGGNNLLDDKINKNWRLTKGLKECGLPVNQGLLAGLETVHDCLKKIVSLPVQLDDPTFGGILSSVVNR